MFLPPFTVIFGLKSRKETPPESPVADSPIETITTVSSDSTEALNALTTQMTESFKSLLWSTLNSTDMYHRDQVGKYQDAFEGIKNRTLETDYNSPEQKYETVREFFLMFMNHLEEDGLFQHPFGNTSVRRFVGQVRCYILLRDWPR